MLCEDAEGTVEGGYPQARAGPWCPSISWIYLHSPFAGLNLILIGIRASYKGYGHRGGAFSGISAPLAGLGVLSHGGGVGSMVGGGKLRVVDGGDEFEVSGSLGSEVEGSCSWKVPRSKEVRSPR